MSSKSRVSVAVAFIAMGILLLLAAPAARAGVLYWDHPADGCWDTDSYWATDDCGNGKTGWLPGDDANFYVASGGTGSTITIVDPVNVNSVTFTGSGYAVTGGR